MPNAALGVAGVAGATVLSDMALALGKGLFI